MKLKRTILLAACVVALGLMLVALFAHAAHAITVELDPGTPGEPANDLNFETDHEAFVIDVLFKDNKTLEYGEGTHSFFFRVGPFLEYGYFGSLLDAAGEVILGTEFIGAFPSDSDPVGFPAVLDLSQTTFFSGMRFVAVSSEGGPGLPGGAFKSLNWFSSPEPTVRVVLEGDPVTIGGTVTGLIGSGLVLQNNGGDDLSIDSEGHFTFATSLQPGLTYNVTVLTNPTDPIQLCSVENGSGDVPTENVTDVAVTCVEPEAGIKKVAAEGDILDDGTTLKSILLDGGVAINIDGQVAFGGKDGNDNKAAFTQAGKEVTEGDTLPDDTTLAAFRGQGEVAINAGPSGDMVAFHGQAETGKNDTTAVFTQAGKIAAVGDALSADISVDDIDPEGKVAINNFDQVAFHGRVEIEDGLYDDHFGVVFISDGVETLVAAQEDSNLPDGTPLDDITESGGVAINDFDEVAFHGLTGDIKAVFTSEGLAAKVGDLLDESTTLQDINENGGVAINLFGQVAFYGQTGVPDTDGDPVKAVFVSDGETTRVIARVGDTLPDGKPLDDIVVSGGVAINIFGDVAFHGRTDDIKAVFTQNGVVAKVGDLLDDISTLNDIWTDGGVAITPYGFDVAFHGQTGTTDAVLVGQAPEAPPPANGEESSGE